MRFPLGGILSDQNNACTKYNPVYFVGSVPYDNVSEFISLFIIIDLRAQHFLTRPVVNIAANKIDF